MLWSSDCNPVFWRMINQTDWMGQIWFVIAQKRNGSEGGSGLLRLYLKMCAWRGVNVCTCVMCLYVKVQRCACQGGGVCEVRLLCVSRSEVK